MSPTANGSSSHPDAETGTPTDHRAVLSLSSRAHKEISLTLIRLAQGRHLTAPDLGEDWGTGTLAYSWDQGTRVEPPSEQWGKSSKGEGALIWDAAILFPRGYSLEEFLYLTRHRMFIAHCYKMKYCHGGSFNNMHKDSLLGDGYIGTFLASLKDRL